MFEKRDSFMPCAPARVVALARAWSDTGSIQGFSSSRQCFARTRKPPCFYGRPRTLACWSYPKPKHRRGHHPWGQTLYGGPLSWLRLHKIYRRFSQSCQLRHGFLSGRGNQGWARQREKKHWSFFSPTHFGWPSPKK